ncbi:hypothetical protein SAMN02799624_01890 [Paenibacillus sp. UNC496MF]|uniref:hypothetical protein n=1 Tax=Paenibacillus sp. UNC496MF TaxID=1502753 RepID=UPI0008EF26CF|nr:hypothetical protein [Paenibacillus sp. UNC496MF]SFI72445.1 hypothetical protein SAMN02799624_01890 [Paenibacillus sp. UNC496MF]
MRKRERYLLLPVLLLVLAASACSSGAERFKASLPGSAVTKIELTCAELCQRMDKPPFQSRMISDEGEIRTFVQVLGDAKKMAGALDYGALFRMRLYFENGSRKDYVLNIEDGDGWKGLLVDSEHSSQGWEISEQDAKTLRGLIYRRD